MSRASSFWLIEHLRYDLNYVMIRPLSQLAEIQEYIDDLGDKRSPEAMFIGEAIVVYTFELIEVVIDQSVKRRVKFPLRSISI